MLPQYVCNLKNLFKVPTSRLRVNRHGSFNEDLFPGSGAGRRLGSCRCEAEAEDQSGGGARAGDSWACDLEYLTDEFVHLGESFSSRNPQMQAVQMLMAVNRQIYFECPEVPPFGRRFLLFLRLRAA